MFSKIQEIAHFLADDSSSNTYLRYSYEFVRKHLVGVGERIKNVRVLIKFLDNSKNSAGTIEKDKLISLFAKVGKDI